LKKNKLKIKRIFDTITSDKYKEEKEYFQSMLKQRVPIVLKGKQVFGRK